MGRKPGSHICGKTNKIWTDLADAGLFFFSVDNCEDLHEVKLTVGDRMQIAGNVPPVDVMLYGTIDDVINSCKECIKKNVQTVQRDLFWPQAASYLSELLKKM